jgi:predicted enzyme involved in methoxymalonyl-ACP biosynthesis
VLGRGVETAVWPQIVDDAVARGCSELRADFVPTAKNAQVADFYDRLGLRIAAEADDGSRSYRIEADDFDTPPPAWIEMSSVG